MRWMTGSISTASTRSAPHASARLTSLPEPAPMIRTSLNGLPPESRLSRWGNAYAGNRALSGCICWWPIRLTLISQCSGTIADAVIGRPHLAPTDATTAPPRARRRQRTVAGQRGATLGDSADTGSTPDPATTKANHHAGESSQERARRKQDDARDAAEDVDGVGLEAVGQLCERAAQLLSRPHHRQRDDEEEIAAEQLRSGSRSSTDRAPDTRRQRTPLAATPGCRRR